MVKRAKSGTLAETVEATGLAEAHGSWLRQHPR